MADGKSGLPNWALPTGAAIAVGGAVASYYEAKMQSTLLRHASVMAGINADYTSMQTEVAERDFRKASSVAIGVAKTVAGSSGFASDSASNLDAIEDMDRNIDLNAQAIRAEGRIKEGVIRDQQKSLESQSRTTSIFGKAKAAETLASTTLNLLAAKDKF